MTISVVLITHNEETNLARTLKSVLPLVKDGEGEIVVVDSGSTDRTVEIAQSLGVRVFVESWAGFAAQKNSAIAKATGDWILSLDADEELDSNLQQSVRNILETSKQSNAASNDVAGFWIPRKNHFLGRWIKHGGFWPDPKLRLFRRGTGRFGDRAVHETLVVSGKTADIDAGALLHYSYPTLSDYIDHMNRYSSLGAEMVVARGRPRFSALNIAVRPGATFIYNYFFRLGFLDGREGFLLHCYHAIYVSWKYAKAWELDQNA